MKIWRGYGSEHSANLVMIGRFKDAKSAREAKEAMDKLGEQQSKDAQNSAAPREDVSDRYSDGMLAMMQEVHVHSIMPAEFEQFNLNINVELKNAEIHVTTDEVEISAFLKILIDKGAKVQVYSADYYPEEKK